MDNQVACRLLRFVVMVIQLVITISQ